MYVCVLLPIYPSIYLSLNLSLCLPACLPVSVCLPIHMIYYMCICVCVCMHACMHACMHTYIHTYTIHERLLDVVQVTTMVKLHLETWGGSPTTKLSQCSPRESYLWCLLFAGSRGTQPDSSLELRCSTFSNRECR